jgi:hypothetical protein
VEDQAFKPASAIHAHQLLRFPVSLNDTLSPTAKDESGEAIPIRCLKDLAFAFL